MWGKILQIHMVILLSWWDLSLNFPLNVSPDYWMCFSGLDVWLSYKFYSSGSCIIMYIVTSVIGDRNVYLMLTYISNFEKPPGSGRFLIWLARRNPDSGNYLGLEIRQKVWESTPWITSSSLENLLSELMYMYLVLFSSLNFKERCIFLML